MTIRVALADDQPLVRAGLRMVIDATPGIEVIGEAGTGTQVVRLVRELRPDVVVMDIRMPGMDGIEATQMITAETPAARVLMLTTFDDDSNVYASLRAGASGFLVKDMALDDILSAIRVVASGDGLIAPSVTRRLIENLPTVPNRPRLHRPASSPPSRDGSARCSPSSGAACPTRSSRPGSTSPRAPPRRMSRACAPSSAPGTGSSSSSSRTRRGWCHRPADPTCPRLARAPWSVTSYTPERRGPAGCRRPRPAGPAWRRYWTCA
ncbi:LuxR family transcriptional regulator [Streptomyces bingchenggensis BCW-1]|uniref:LuxR family transcriptional regulator n=1 Tax=Streptomyces bingchenggensis (strain BCW-1) TaxID=749414 RepID=D7BZI2_STRBB|nr:LuxR family transcriptional regulator [Streptomyces bingchenggensis BCW-1]